MLSRRSGHRQPFLPPFLVLPLCGCYHSRIQRGCRRRWRGREGRREGDTGRKDTAVWGRFVVVATESLMGRPQLLVTRVVSFPLPALPPLSVRRPFPFLLFLV